MPHKPLCIGIYPLLDLTADWDSRARTCTYLIQSQAPYQFGHIPKIQR